MARFAPVPVRVSDVPRNDTIAQSHGAASHDLTRPEKVAGI